LSVTLSVTVVVPCEYGPAGFLLPVVSLRIAELKKERSYREETPRPDSDSV
jgi:hypothetical protein